MRNFLIAAVITLMGCASTGVVPMDKGTYMVSKRDAQVGFGPPVAAKAEVYSEANDFCAEQGRKVETIDFQGTNSGFGRPASASLHFKCVE
ncbi:MAG: hypothetical protein QNJ78_11080 [Gammaproteobacteria bacterium]|nr:hypothetical protein [Gammaproteobacteria bacterium]